MEEEDLLENSLVYSSEKLGQCLTGKSEANCVIKNFISEVSYPNIQDFTKGLEWFNVVEPLSFEKHLKGKLVLLDFFTYCCINCMHILPHLKQLEHEFSVEDGLVVIGVHSAKFENEKVSSNIRSAVQRYNITHPVVNDSDLVMWQQCQVFSWPTLLLIGPSGNPLIMYIGEGQIEKLRLFIKCALEHYKSINAISTGGIPIKLTHHLPQTNEINKGPSLLFPGKIVSVLEDNGRREILAVSDMGNHRILLLKSNGTIIKQIGSKKQGFQDGTFQDAAFSSPQGLVFDGNSILYVADTHNHAIRRINLITQTVDTIVGNGTQGNDLVGGNVGGQQVLSSPWDLCLYDIPVDQTATSKKKVLFIAMAGTHQIWAYFFQDTGEWWKKNTPHKAGSCVRIAGSGKEENRNNQYPEKAGFAQPSGLAISHKNQELYIADSESSTIRKISLANGKVSAVVGGGRNPEDLFQFGDHDGQLYNAGLQHPIGIGMSNDDRHLFVADSYNHKIKVVDLTTNTIKTLPVASSLYNEPNGLCMSKFSSRNDRGLLYIADTNNHRIKTITISSIENMDRGIVHDEFQLKYEETCVDSASRLIKPTLPVYECTPMKLNSLGANLMLRVHLVFQNGTTLTKDAPQKWHCELSANGILLMNPTSGKNVEQIDIRISTPACDKMELLDITVAFYSCYLDTCSPRNFVIRQPITFDNKWPNQLDANVNVTVDATNISLTF